MKNRNTYKLKRLSVMLLATVLFAACTKRDLEIRPGIVEVSFEWPEGAHPSAAHLHFYREDGRLLEIHDKLTEGYIGRLPVGDYLLIVHNEDARHVDYDDIESHQQAEVYATTPGGEAPTEGCLLAEPRNVYGAGEHDGGSKFSVRSGDTTRLTVTPERLTKNVRLYFRVKGMDDLASLSGTLNGVSPSVLFCNCTSLPISCRMAFEAQTYKSDDRKQLLASLSLFDLLTRTDSPEGTNTVDIVLNRTGGTSYRTTADITPALQNILLDHAGEFPSDIAVELSIAFGPLGVLTVTVSPWHEVDSGGGEI